MCVICNAHWPIAFGDCHFSEIDVHFCKFDFNENSLKTASAALGWRGHLCLFIVIVLAKNAWRFKICIDIKGCL